MPEPSSDPAERVIPTRDACARLVVRKIDSDLADLRIARRSLDTLPGRPESWKGTLAGFRVTRIMAIELRAVLRETFQI